LDEKHILLQFHRPTKDMNAVQCWIYDKVETLDLGRGLVDRVFQVLDYSSESGEQFGKFGNCSHFSNG